MTRGLPFGSGEIDRASHRIVSRRIATLPVNRETRSRLRIKFGGRCRIDNIAIRRDKFVSPALFPREISRRNLKPVRVAAGYTTRTRERDDVREKERRKVREWEKERVNRVTNCGGRNFSTVASEE